MKKKIAFFTQSLGIGGIERAIINYVNKIDKNKYDITLFLENEAGEYLREINSDVKIVDFNLSNNRNILIRKISNAMKLLKFSMKYYHKFYFAANFKTTIKSGAILTKRFSKNNAYWFHGNYWNNNIDAQKFIKKYKIEKYKKIVFVSNYSKNLYTKATDFLNQKLYVINNPINVEDILKRCEEKIKIKSSKTILLNVGRHEESSKKLTTIIKAVKSLINDGYEIELWMVGDGPDTNFYKEMVTNLKIDKYVKFLGFSNNVYPYIKACDVVLLSSIVEGNPVVFLEAKVLNKPVISTNVADAKKELDGYGIVTKNNEKAFLDGLKDFLDNGYKIKKKFNANDYNRDVLNKLDGVIED